MSNCRLTNKKMLDVISFGKMPIANNFLSKEDNFSKEFFFELGISFSEKLSLIQLTNNPNIKKMFHDNYAFYSSTSIFMEKHFQNTKHWLFKNKYLNPEKKNFLIEIGCNDGIFLKNFLKENSVKHLGFEPSKNVCDIAKSKGLNIVNYFFDLNSAKKYSKIFGYADVIYAANAFCHIPNINNVLKGIDVILKDNSFLIFEDPYLGDVLEKISYDQIYDEHIFIFSVISVEKIFKLMNYTLIDVYPLTTHGGSMRYIVQKKSNAKQSFRLNYYKNLEIHKNFHKFTTYLNFRSDCEKSKIKFKNKLLELKDRNKIVFGYGATSKSTTILNYCDVGQDLISYIVDNTPSKFWKFSPGKHIPILPYHLFKKNFPDAYVLFAWNHAEEIKKKEKIFSKNGKWITHLD
jgi:methylation protein EvaC